MSAAVDPRSASYQPPQKMHVTFEHPLAPPEGNYKWVYLWHWPIRAMHWIAAIAIVLLVITGFLIGKPYFLPRINADSPFFIGWMRMIHFAAAGALVATAIVRLYWLFAGNRYERWPALFPIRPRDWANMFRQVKFYLLIQPEKAPHYLGHNPLQQTFYTMTYIAAAIMALTGFALFGQANPDGLMYTLFSWVGPLFGGIQIARVVHHVLTWYFIVFIIAHVYLALRADLLERTGTISSIVSGGRFVEADRTYIDE